VVRGIAKLLIVLTAGFLLVTLAIDLTGYGDSDPAPPAPLPSEPPADETNEAGDTAADKDPVPFWGKVDCVDHPAPLIPGHQRISTDGDPNPTASGDPQDDTAFRRLTVYDGDWIYGERCELGFNNRGGPTAFYREGDHKLTHFSVRLPDTSPIAEPTWRVVMQMKQAQPYSNPNPAAILELQARANHWIVQSNFKPVWSTPAVQNVWTRFVFDVVYTTNPEVGSVTVRVDLNGDGDYVDDVNGDGRVDEDSGPIRQATLRFETAPGTNQTDPGDPLPSHLRMGIYHDAGHSCPRTGSGCSIDIDNVQVVDAGAEAG
jgi:hypothetical protein